MPVKQLTNNVGPTRESRRHPATVHFSIYTKKWTKGRVKAHYDYFKKAAKLSNSFARAQSDYRKEKNPGIVSRILNMFA